MPKVGPDVHRIDDAAVVFGVVVASRFRALISDDDHGIASMQRSGGVLPKFELRIDEVGRGLAIRGPPSIAVGAGILDHSQLGDCDAAGRNGFGVHCEVADDDSCRHFLSLRFSEIVLVRANGLNRPKAAALLFKFCWLLFLPVKGVTQ